LGALVSKQAVHRISTRSVIDQITDRSSVSPSLETGRDIGVAGLVPVPRLGSSQRCEDSFVTCLLQPDNHGAVHKSDANQILAETLARSCVIEDVELSVIDATILAI
jgi:hypothetical protein